MLDIMTQAANAIEAYNSALSVHSANIANMSVNGYKKLNVSFQSVFERALNQGTASNSFSNIGGTNPTQLGQGVAVSSLGVDMSEGPLVDGNPIDLAINGSGLFLVSGDGGNTYQYTRAGQFNVTSDGRLVTQSGMQVYGFNSSGSVMPITGLTAGASGYQWDSNGNLQTTAGAPVGFQIALVYFNNPSGLVQTTGTNFAESLASGSPTSPMTPGGAAGTVSGAKDEQSNVFYLGETIDSLELQRAMSGNLSVVRMASDIISSFISKLG